MSQQIALGVARHVLTALGPIIAMSGVFDAATWEILVGAGLTIAGTVWSVVDKLKKR